MKTESVCRKRPATMTVVGTRSSKAGHVEEERLCEMRHMSANDLDVQIVIGYDLELTQVAFRRLILIRDST